MESGMQHTGLLSRRGVVKGAAGAAAVGAVTLASPRTAQAETEPVPARRGAGRQDHPVVEETMTVHVRDVRAGLLDIYVGERHIQVRDKDLASRLIAAAR